MRGMKLLASQSLAQQLDAAELEARETRDERTDNMKAELPWRELRSGVNVSRRSRLLVCCAGPSGVLSHHAVSSTLGIC